MVAVAAASVLVPLNSTMLVVALPHLLRDLDASLLSGGWLFTIYLITMASLQPVTGKIGDRLGPRRMMLFGLVGFGVASVACAFAPNMATLIALRAGQGIAGAMTMPNATSMMRRLVPASRLGRRMATVGAAITGGAAVGPVAGGLLVGLGGWRAVFLVNVPLVVVIVVIALRGIPDVPGSPADGRFDVAGSIGLLVLLGGAALLLTRARGIDIAVSAAAGAVLLLVAFLFLRYERAHADPVLQPRLFRRIGFTAGVSGTALSNLAMYVTLLATPVLLERREQWPSGAIGGALSSLPLASLLVAPLGGRLADRVGPRIPATIGMALTVGALLGLVAGVRDVALVACLSVAGLGFGFAFSSFQLSALASAEASIAGAASGVMSTCRYAGSILGTSLLAGALAPVGTNFRPVFVMTAVAALGAGILATLLPRVIHPDEDEITAAAEDPAGAVP